MSKVLIGNPKIHPSGRGARGNGQLDYDMLKASANMNTKQLPKKRVASFTEVTAHQLDGIVKRPKNSLCPQGSIINVKSFNISEMLGV